MNSREAIEKILEKTHERLEGRRYDAWACNVAQDMVPRVVFGKATAIKCEILLYRELQRLNVAYVLEKLGVDVIEIEVGKYIRLASHPYENIHWIKLQYRPIDAVLQYTPTVTVQRTPGRHAQYCNERRKLVKYWIENINYDLLEDLE